MRIGRSNGTNKPVKFNCIEVVRNINYLTVNLLCEDKRVFTFPTSLVGPFDTLRIDDVNVEVDVFVRDKPPRPDDGITLKDDIKSMLVNLHKHLPNCDLRRSVGQALLLCGDFKSNEKPQPDRPWNGADTCPKEPGVYEVTPLDDTYDLTKIVAHWNGEEWRMASFKAFERLADQNLLWRKTSQ